MKIIPNIYVKVRKLWNTMFGKDGDGDEIKLIKANPTAGESDPDLTGLEIDGNKYKIPEATEVVANPTLAGTEEDLEGLQVGNTKYKVPSGGGATRYEHHLRVIYNHASSGAGDPAKYARIYLTIETDSDDEITTISALNTALQDFDYVHELMSSGYYHSGTDAYNAPVSACYYDGTALTVEVLYFTNSGSSFQAFGLSDTTAYTIKDVVK